MLDQLQAKIFLKLSANSRQEVRFSGHRSSGLSGCAQRMFRAACATPPSQWLNSVMLDRRTTKFILTESEKMRQPPLDIRLPARGLLAARPGGCANAPGIG
jgi:hypothetical protein